MGPFDEFHFFSEEKFSDVGWRGGQAEDPSLAPSKAVTCFACRGGGGGSLTGAWRGGGGGRGRTAEPVVGWATNEPILFLRHGPVAACAHGPIAQTPRQGAPACAWAWAVQVLKDFQSLTVAEFMSLTSQNIQSLNYEQHPQVYVSAMENLQLPLL